MSLYSNNDIYKMILHNAFDLGHCSIKMNYADYETIFDFHQYKTSLYIHLNMRFALKLVIA